MKPTTEQIFHLNQAYAEAEIALNISLLWSLDAVDFGFVVVHVSRDDIAVTTKRGAAWSTNGVTVNGFKLLARILTEASDVYDSLHAKTEDTIPDE